MFPPESKPTTPPQTLPAGVNHYNTFACVLSLGYMGLFLLLCYLVFQTSFSSGPLAYELLITSLFMCILHAASLFFPRKKWAWIAHITIAALATGSCFFSPFSIYIIARYLEPEVKGYFDA